MGPGRKKIAESTCFNICKWGSDRHEIIEHQNIAPHVRGRDGKGAEAQKDTDINMFPYAFEGKRRIREV